MTFSWFCHHDWSEWVIQYYNRYSCDNDEYWEERYCKKCGKIEQRDLLK